MGRIRRTAKKSSPPALAAGTATLDMIDEEMPDELSSARQYYLDAMPVAAGVLVLADSGPALIAANPMMALLMNDSQLNGDRDALRTGIADYLASDAAETSIPWQEPGIGGRHFVVKLSRLPAAAGHQRRCLITLIDRTAEIETERSLRTEMLHDSLTGLPNRVAFTETVDEAIVDAQGADGFAVLAIDLTRFSRVNECMGSIAGDELIITVARRLVSALRSGDVLARMAGDEFAVLLRLIDGPGDALHAARRIQSTLATPVRLSDLEIRIECAVGCALMNDRVLTSSELVRNAQVALKRAKRSGRIEVYQAGEVNAARRRFSLETDLRRAIEGDQLHLAFQPLIDLESNAVAGFEALARWQHPQHGAIAPAEFITVAEESGLIVPLGRWVLDAAAKTMADWDRAMGRRLPIYMGVNVSADQIQRDDIAQAVASVIASSGIGGARLTLELTESSIIGDPERAQRVLDGLKGLDCQVAMDDFGTGYSSLAYLQKLPIDVLKIDRSFVTGMLGDRDAVAIVRAILGLADALGMKTTAEGVETVELAQTLAALGCTTAQGYYYARPLAADAALAYFAARSA